MRRANVSEVHWPLPRAQAVERAVERTVPSKRKDGTLMSRSWVCITHEDWLALASAAMQWAQREE